MYFQTVLIFLLWTTCTIAVVLQELEYYDDTDQVDQEDVGKTASEWTRKIEIDVLRKVGKDPPFTLDNPIDAQFMFSSIDHVSVDEKEQTITTSGRYCMVWQDSRLKWNPLEYNGVTDLHVAPYDIWTPDMNVLFSLDGLNSGSKTTIVDRVHIFVNFLAAFVVTCPRFVARVGCALDLSHYPNDRHECVFMVGTRHWKNIKLSQAFDTEKMQVNMRHIFTRNDTRPTVSDFSVVNMTTRIRYFDGVNVTDEEADNNMRVAYQTISFRRIAPYFYTTVQLPCLLFAVLNMSATLVHDTSQSIALFLVNILFIGLFLQDMMDKLPLYYTTLPNSVLFWVVHLVMSVFGLIFVSVREILRRHDGEVYVVHKLSSNMGDCRPACQLKNVISLRSSFVILSLLSIIILFF